MAECEKYLNIRVIFDTNIHSYNICIVLFHTEIFGYLFVRMSHSDMGICQKTFKIELFWHSHTYDFIHLFEMWGSARGKMVNAKKDRV